MTFIARRSGEPGGFGDDEVNAVMATKRTTGTKATGTKTTVTKTTARLAEKSPSSSAASLPDPNANAGWTFLTNHAHVLFCLAERPDDARVRDVAARVGITERAVQRILGELEEAGYIERARVGRRSVYVVNDALPLRHPIEAHRRIADLLTLVHEERRPGAGLRLPRRSSV